MSFVLLQLAIDHWSLILLACSAVALTYYASRQKYGRSAISLAGIIAAGIGGAVS